MIALDGERFIVVHLMVTGRFRWLAPGAKVPGKVGLAAFDFDDGTLLMLPKGALGRQMRSKLKVYAGAEHPHEAQRPEPLHL